MKASVYLYVAVISNILVFVWDGMRAMVKVERRNFNNSIETLHGKIFCMKKLKTQLNIHCIIQFMFRVVQLNGIANYRISNSIL